MRNNLRFQILFFAAAAACMAPALAQSVAPETIRRFSAEVSPALCIVSYSSAITNPATGESTSRETKALGLLVSADGLVMTHGHMQRENSEPSNVRVSIGEGDDLREFDARVLSKPPDVNISFLRIQDAGPFPFARFATDDSLALGDPIMALGMLGESLDYARAVQVHRIGAILQEPRTTYCIDNPVPFGFVSGPVANQRGQIVGVVGFDLAPQEGGDLFVRSGHPLVYQSSLFRKHIESPPSASTDDPAAPDAWLGVYTQPLSDDLAEYWGLPRTGGVVVSTIIAGSPAAEVGLARGDILTEFNETRLRARQDADILGFTKLVRDAGVGSTVNVKYLRDGQPAELTVTLAERPRSARDAVEFEDEVFGLTVRELTTDLRIRLNLPADVQGVIVRRVKSGSWANIAGMVPGLIILRFGEHETPGIEAFEEAVNKVAEAQPAEVPVFCRAGDRTGFFRLNPRWTRPAEE
jgi:serine protease Do